jgi:RNA polymerase sigma-70 factor (ECF subfamily)
VDPDTDQLLEMVRRDEPGARDRLLARHRDQLRALIALRMDPRLRARIDPSDVVQDSLAEADRRLPGYLRDRPLPFYPWLRGLALERLAQLRRHHVASQKRSVEREEHSLGALPDDSVRDLAARLVGRGSSPSARMRHEELKRRLREILDQMGEHDREVIVLRHLEQLSVRDIAAVLEISEGAVKVRHVRALERLRKLLDDEGGSERP